MRRARDRSKAKSGQAIIFLMVVMVIGLFIVLWNFDLHNTVSTKVRVGNAGDAAALSAARWQGITMNMVGELNLMQAALLLEDPLSASNIETCQDLAELRSRISLNGPLIGFIAAQAAGFMNLKEKDMDRVGANGVGYLASRAAEFMATGDSGLYRGRVPGAYDGAWSEYGTLLSAITQGDMLVTSANTSYYLFYDESSGSHTLLEPSFYDAIASSAACWFAYGYRSLLSGYQDYSSWPSLPPISERPAVNSEYFSTDLEVVDTDLVTAVSRAYSRVVAADSDEENSNYGERFYRHVTEEENNLFAGEIDRTNIDENYWIMISTNISEITWHFYNEEEWYVGGFMDVYGGLFDGIKIKPEFDYLAGADAAVDIYLEPFSIAPGMHIDYDDIRWRAAAKPFGWLDPPSGSNAGEKKIPHYFGMVLPAFHQARLILNVTSTRTQGASEPGWDEHIYEHVPEYLSGGLDPITDNGCYYCDQLHTWENPDFRAAMDEWLQRNQDDSDGPRACDLPVGGGGGGGGGVGGWR